MRIERRLLSVCFLVASIAFWSPVGTAAQTAQTTIRSNVPGARISIDNFGQVNGGYYRGAQPEGRDYADLAAMGVKTVIDLQRDGLASEPQFVEAAGMRFYRIPMTTRESPTREQLNLFLQLVNDPANQPVYVHCAGGRHRTGVMTAVYRLTQDRWTADQAFSEMKRFKFGADFLHPEFKRFVYAYQVPPEPVVSVVEADATTTISGGSR